MIKLLKKHYLSITLVLMLAFGVFSFFMFNHQAWAQNENLYGGQTGNEVVKVQQRLSQWGFYHGPVDGVYGAKTMQAVKKFQSHNGLRADGVTGSATWERMGFHQARSGPVTQGNKKTGNIPQWSPAQHAASRNQQSTQLLAKVIAGEARGEPYLGKVAVGAVMMNRVQSAAFPNTLPGVVYQSLAFESVSNGQYNRSVDDESMRAAQQVMNGWDPTNGALYFWNPSKKVSPWIWSRKITMRLGSHVFGV